MSEQKFIINGFEIHENNRPYCIAEVGINHNGILSNAKKMIEIAKDSGADAVKFQTFKAEELCGDINQMFTYKSQGKEVTESMLKMFKRYEFSKEKWKIIKEHCDEKKITFFSSPQNQTDLDILLPVGVSAIKVGSDDFINLPLLEGYAKSGLPLILSCGMSDIGEVHNALDAVGWYDGYPTTVLLCTSQYPTPPIDVNINKIKTLKNAFPGLVVGFSDHTQGSLAASLAVAKGARIFEKHFTLDNSMPGPDHWFSANPNDLKQWVESINTSYLMMGSSYVRPTETEKEMRIIARRSISALNDIYKGDVYTASNVGMRRPGGGLPASMLKKVIGLKASNKIIKGQLLEVGDITNLNE